MDCVTCCKMHFPLPSWEPEMRLWVAVSFAIDPFMGEGEHKSKSINCKQTISTKGLISLTTLILYSAFIAKDVCARAGNWRPKSQGNKGYLESSLKNLATSEMAHPGLIGAYCRKLPFFPISYKTANFQAWKLPGDIMLRLTDWLIEWWIQLSEYQLESRISCYR